MPENNVATLAADGEAPPEHDLSADGLPPIPQLVDGHQNETFLTRADKARRYRRSTRTIARWELKGVLPPPVLTGPVAGSTPLSKLLEREASWRAAAA